VELRPLAREIVERHGSDTLSFFKLRPDKHHFFDSSRFAFVGYRIEAGVLLVSGDPVGPPAALPGLLRELCSFAEARGLAIGVLGASEDFATLAAGAGLGSFYIGDRRRLLAKPSPHIEGVIAASASREMKILPGS
jgi:lysyl-tRNA synthetase class 2